MKKVMRLSAPLQSAQEFGLFGRYVDDFSVLVFIDDDGDVVREVDLSNRNMLQLYRDLYGGRYENLRSVVYLARIYKKIDWDDVHSISNDVDRLLRSLWFKPVVDFVIIEPTQVSSTLCNRGCCPKPFDVHKYRTKENVEEEYYSNRPQFLAVEFDYEDVSHVFPEFSIDECKDIFNHISEQLNDALIVEGFTQIELLVKQLKM